MTIHCHRTMHRGIALSLHGIIVIYSSHRLETDSSTQTSMGARVHYVTLSGSWKKTSDMFIWTLFFDEICCLIKGIRLADAILCHMHYLSNTQITSNDGRFCFKARTINIHLVSRYEDFKSMPNDYELLCLYTFEDRVKESSFVFRGLSSHSRIVHSYGDVTIRAANFVLYMLVTHGHWAVRVHDTHTYCWAFSSGAVTTCFYDLVLSWLNFEHPTFRMRGERSNPLRHRRGV